MHFEPQDGRDPVDRNTVPDADELIEGVKRAVSEAIDDLHRRGIPTVHRIGGQLVKVMPDGTHRTTDSDPPRQE